MSPPSLSSSSMYPLEDSVKEHIVSIIEHGWVQRQLRKYEFSAPLVAGPPRTMAEASISKPHSVEHLPNCRKCRQVKDRYELLMRYLHPVVTKDIYHVYHVTLPRQKEKIIRDGIIEKEFLEVGFNAKRNQHFLGVFLEFNLSTSESLPSDSTNGSERVKFPISALKEKCLHLFFHSWFQDEEGDRYVFMVLVRERHEFLGKHPCEHPPIKHLHELDLKNNPLLQLDFDSNTFSYYYNLCAPVWLELVVLGDVLMTSEQEWEYVTHTITHTIESSRTALP